MSALNPNVTEARPALELVSPRPITETPPAGAPEMALMARLRRGGNDDGIDTEWLTARLEEESEPTRLWELLSCVEHLPPRSVDLEPVFEALSRLAIADAPLLRCAAYRWLAGLHRINLRYGMRAKLVMRDGLDRETGLARRRLQHLLTLC